jgi:hypothetical protein
MFNTLDYFDSKKMFKDPKTGNLLLALEPYVFCKTKEASQNLKSSRIFSFLMIFAIG